MTEKNYGILCHLSALSMLVFPLGNIVGPLIVYLLKKDDLAIVATEGKEALNFQITISIIGFIALIFNYRFALLAAVVSLVFIVLASIEASNGRAYRYPFNFRLIK